MKILLFAGAGTSMELGVPGMVGLANEFIDHAKQWNVEPDMVQDIMDKKMDLEYLIESLDHLYTARPSLKAIGQDSIEFDRVDKVRAEIEWFVQHAAERIALKDAHLMWGPILRTLKSVNSLEITIVTTNYDRAIELAANAESVNINDGFDIIEKDEISTWMGFDQREGGILVKLHGSTDWYSDAHSGQPIKLRHPMPLFGRALLRLVNGYDLGSALVLPSREKMLTHKPYPRLSQKFLNAADQCDIAIFIGSSLRDNHVRDTAELTACRVPVFIVTPSGENFGINNAKAIKQHASSFLIATLSSVLISSKPIERLEAISKSTNNKPIFTILRDALSNHSSTEIRCQALDRLDNLGITLDSYILRELISTDDPNVARYSLSLILHSPEREELIREAENTTHVNDPAFSKDLQLLREMASSRNRENE